ncbi:MAG: creatininase family protein [Betaproteobacteria bacterium]|nr:creatininase family protein [Betaproteobacteria bacterium]NBY05685.1 creatininase family protein [Betaproteobacteria bacterium]
MKLQMCTWLDVQNYLKQSQGIVIPMGSTEQHGPSGLIGTDAITSEFIAAAMAENNQILIAPTLSLGPAAFNLNFPGTICLRPSTWINIVVDCVESLAHQGFRCFYFLNGHGGNIAPTLSAIQEVQRSRSTSPLPLPPLMFRVKSWWEFPEVNDLRQAWYGDGEGMHATPSEISITKHLFPQMCPEDQLPPAKSLDKSFYQTHAGDQHLDANSHRLQFPDGRVGSNSALSNPAHGKILLNTAAKAAVLDYLSLIEEHRA